MRSKKLRENETISLESNERDILNKHGNQEGILQIVYKRFVTGKEERVMKKISYYVTILKEFIGKEKQTGKAGSELVEWVKTNQDTIKGMNSYHDSTT